MSPRHEPTDTFRFPSETVSRLEVEVAARRLARRDARRPRVLADEALDECGLAEAGGRTDAVDVPGRRLEVDERQRDREGCEQHAEILSVIRSL